MAVRVYLAERLCRVIVISLCRFVMLTAVCSWLPVASFRVVLFCLEVVWSQLFLLIYLLLLFSDAFPDVFRR